MIVSGSMTAQASHVNARTCKAAGADFLDEETIKHIMLAHLLDLMVAVRVVCRFVVHRHKPHHMAPVDVVYRSLEDLIEAIEFFDPVA